MKRALIFLIIFFSIMLQIKSQIPSIKISAIKVSGKNVFLSKTEKLSILENDKLQIEFQANDNALENSYQVILNDKAIDFNNNLIEIENLYYGKYTLRIEGQMPTGEDLLPTAFSFSVNKLKVPESQNTYFSSFSIILIILVAVQLVIILFLVRRKKSGKNNNDKTELDEIKTAYNTLKEGYKKLENKNRHLNFKVEDLKKNIGLLEDANLALLKQKEKLAIQKIKLEELQKQKDKIFAIAVHDIKNPASAIKGLLELLTSYDLNAMEQKEIMESLISSSESILNLTQNIAQSIILEEPAELLHKEKGSLQEIINGVVAINSAAAKRKGIKLINKSSSSIPEIEMDKQKIEEAIDNLVNNAIKYSPSGTEVILKSYFSSTDVSVEVSDDGVGLSAEDQKKAFQKGITLTPRPTAGETSSGLGLWIVKTIIEEHAGNVWVKSKLGVGSSFGFNIPIK